MRKFLKNKNNLLILSGLLIIFGLLFSLQVYGQARLETDWPVAPGGKELTATSTLVDFIDYAYRWAMLLGGLFAFFALIMGGFQYLTSVGDPNKMRDAKERIIAAILGLVLLLSTYVILNTLNPELLTVRVPTTSVPWGDYGGWEAPDLGQPCEFVEIYEEKDYKGRSALFGPGPGGTPFEECRFAGTDGFWLVGWGEMSTFVGSVKMSGACQLNLYEKNNCTGNFASIARSMPNLKWIAVDKIKGMLVTDISVPTPPEVRNIGVSSLVVAADGLARATLTGELYSMNKNDVCYSFFEHGANPLFLTQRLPSDPNDDPRHYTTTTFQQTAHKLATNTIYYWRAAVRSEAGMSFGTTASFTTPF